MQYRRFEVISAGLFGALPETSIGVRRILVIEDNATRYVEFLPLKIASVEACARSLVYVAIWVTKMCH